MSQVPPLVEATKALMEVALNGVDSVPAQLIDPAEADLPGGLDGAGTTLAGQARRAANLMASVMFFFGLARIAYRALTQQPLTDGLRPLFIVIVVIFLIANGPGLVNGLGIF